MIFKPFMRENFIPLPVAFISTISKEGVRNIAPYGCLMPILRPLDLICLASAFRRDTLKNTRETGEFVVNLAGSDLAEKVMPTARFTPPDTDEFEVAGLTGKPSETIRAPGIEECFGWMECRLHKEYVEQNYTIVVGQVLRLEISDNVLNDDGSLNLQKANPLMMTGTPKGMNYCTVRDIDRIEPFGAMFPDGKDPRAEKYVGKA
jgi:flavin reductase (DIM6/NTAB) family NADH-FMN oxidoreductase RutF